MSLSCQEALSGAGPRSGSCISEDLDRCPLCAGHSLGLLGAPGHWIGEEVFGAGAGIFGLNRCRDCSLVFVNPRPDQSLLNEFYAGTNYVCHEPNSGSLTTARFLLDRVEACGPYESRRFLDFGCGGGFLLRAATEAGWEGHGYDVGARALASCQQQRLKVTNDLASFDHQGFDIVVLNHVFEHIAQSEDILKTCRMLLARGGRLFLVVPNAGSLRARLAFPFLSKHFNVDERYRAFPIHMFYYTVETIARVIERNSLHVIKIETFGLGLDEFVNQAPRASAPRAPLSSPAGKNLKAWLRPVVKKWLFDRGLGENLMVVADVKQ